MTAGRAAWWLLLVGQTALACALAPAQRAAPVVGGPPPSTDDEAFRRRPPEPGPLPSYVPPVPRLTVLPNGMRLLVVARPTIHVVAGELVVRGGSAAFPAEPPVLFDILADASLTGTSRASEQDIYGAMNGFELRTSAGDAWVSYRFRAIAASAHFALQALRDIALFSTFPQSPLDMKRARSLANSSRDADDAVLIGKRSLYAAVFGASHPYARAWRSPVVALTKLTRADVVRVWHDYLDPTETVLVVAGDVDVDLLDASVQRLFGAWRRDPGVLARTPVPPPQPMAERLTVVDRPGSTVSTVLVGAATASINAPQRPATVVVSGMLGGLRSSAVASQLRDEPDPTVSIRAELEPRRVAGITLWRWRAAAGGTARTLTVFDQQVRELGERGPTPAALAAAKSAAIRAMPRALETVEGIVGRLADIAAYDLPLDDLSTFPARLEAVSADDVRAAVPDPAAMKVVVVGDLAALRQPLLALGWGPIAVRDANGDLVETIAPRGATSGRGGP